MDPTLKKRLIGAAILIVLAAIILPMFLGGPPQSDPTGTTLPLDIPPAPDRDLAQVTLPLPAGATPEPEPDPDRIAAVDTSQLPPPAEPAPAEPAPSLPEPAPSPADPGTAPAPAAPATPAPAPAAPAARPVPTAAVPATSAGGRFWVALGSYGQAANADRVANAARAAAIEIERSTVNTGGRELIRLRAGPWTTRAQAEQARQLLLAAVPDARPRVEDSGAAASADAPAPAAGEPAHAGAWAVQVGAFAQVATAEQLATRLRAAGYPAFVERRGDSHAVRVGPYVRRTEAEAQRQQLKSGQQLDGLIVAHPG
jgi:DedD protein